MSESRYRQHSSHWGAFSARMKDGRLDIKPFEHDPDPSPLLANIGPALSHPARLSRPLIRRGWLEDGPGPDDRRGLDDYVEVPWDEALDLAAAELIRLGGGALPRQGSSPACTSYLRRLLRLGVRRAFPSCPKPGPSVLEHSFWWLCPLCRHIFLGGGGCDPFIGLG